MSFPPRMEIDVSEKSGHSSPVILHVMVIGFHHKKGAQVDFCHPPLNYVEETTSKSDNKSHTSSDCCEAELEKHLPAEWSSLPSLSLPDGAHNFLSDTVFFHLNLPQSRRTRQDSPIIEETSSPLVYCICCYKQILASESIREKDSSVTRSTIMKSVVVMSRLPFYGLIGAKVESMTGVYFKQQDFGDKACLIELYNNLNYILSPSQREIISPMETSLLSLSPSRHLLSVFGHRTLVLLKLLLLEKKVLFFLNLSSNPSIPSLTSTSITQYQSFPIPGSPEGPEGSTLTVKSLCLIVLTLASLLPENFDSHTKDYHLYCNHCQALLSAVNSPVGTPEPTIKSPQEDVGEVVNEEDAEESNNTQSDVSRTAETNQQSSDSMLNTKTQSIPAVKVFRDGNVIHPYICLSFIDDIKDCKACIVGATNALFKQKKSSLFDAFVDCESGKIEYEDPDLKKQMNLSTEDLRFMKFLCEHCQPYSTLDKHGRPSSPGQHMDTDNFEGSDDWLRIQFNLYLLHALRTSFLREDSKAVSSFNSHFMKAWREKSENYKDWKERFLKGILSRECFDADQVEEIIKRSFNHIKPGHPYMNAKGASVVSDMKLKFMSNYGHSIFSGTSSPAGYAASPNSNGSPSSTLTAAAATYVPSMESLQSKKQSVVEASKNALSSAKSTFTSWINSNTSNTGTAAPNKDGIPTESMTNNYESSSSMTSIDSAHDVLQTSFNGITFSSLLQRDCQRSEDESIEEVVYDRMKLMTMNPNEN